ncbi:MAG: hypothetical protein KF744_09060 [Taibaiella sp.]|nr:hypothetical protein [Taibaiella sp.]
MSYVGSKIRALMRQLMPNGRAFNIPAGGYFDKLEKSLSGTGSNLVGTGERTYNDVVSTLDSMLADNPNFTDGTADVNNNDCRDWERRLGLTVYGPTSADTPTTDQRKAMIRTKYNYPGTNRPRQAAEYLQEQLRNAGFDVYVYENIFMPGAVTKTPEEILGLSVMPALLGAFELGTTELGQTWATNNISIVQNHVDEEDDAYVGFFGDQWRGTFYIAGATITDFADVPAVRRNEFRQMILRLKPAHMTGIMFVVYT